MADLPVGESTPVTGEDEREKRSIAEIEKWMQSPTHLPTLEPTMWALDESQLSDRLTARLAARRDHGLPVPLHAYGADAMTQYTDRERARISAATPKRPHLGAIAWDRSPLTQHVGPVTDRMLDELEHLLPSTEDTAPSSTKFWRTRHSPLEHLTIGAQPGGRSDLLLLPTVLAVVFPLTILATLFGIPVALGTLVLAIFGVGALTLVRGAISLDLRGRDYQELLAATVSRGPEPGTPECRIAQIAVDVATRIQDSPAWQSDFLDMHRIQLDPQAEADQIIEHATRISTIRTALGPLPTGDSAAADRARQERARDDRMLAAVLSSLVERTAALYRYSLELGDLDEEYLALTAIENSATASTDIDELLRQTGLDTIAADRIQRLTADARALRSSITARIQVLGGDLHTLHALEGHSHHE